MKNSIYLVMNYWPKEDYWLCSEFYKRHITYRLIGIDSKVRKLRYAKWGWNLENTPLRACHKSCRKYEKG